MLKSYLSVRAAANTATTAAATELGTKDDHSSAANADRTAGAPTVATGPGLERRGRLQQTHSLDLLLPEGG